MVPYELKLLLQHCIQSGYFSIMELNNRIAHYDFVDNAPTQIDPQIARHPEHKMRQSATQMIALAFEFPVLIGDKVPSTDEKWRSFVLLLKICSITLSPICTHDTLAYLRVLIEEKLSTFRGVYPSAKLIPKFHFMVHYPSQIEMYGPLVHSWTMRHEAKLSFIKRASRRGNFKNICLTVARTHQLWLCYQLECEHYFLYPQPQISSLCTEAEFSTESEGLQMEFRRQLEEIHEDCTVKHPRWVRIQACSYKAGAFVLLERDDMSPTFGEVLDISFIEGSDFVLYVQKYATVYFDPHYTSFAVRRTGNFLYVSCNNLAYHHPLNVRKSFESSNRNLYITIRSTY